jgi:hypothetical protein
MDQIKSIPMAFPINRLHFDYKTIDRVIFGTLPNAEKAKVLVGIFHIPTNYYMKGY